MLPGMHLATARHLVHKHATCLPQRTPEFRFTATIFGGAADPRFTNANCQSIDPLILFFVVFLARSYFSLRYRVVGRLSDFFVVGVGQVC